MTEEQIDYISWLMSMAIGTPIVMAVYWLGFLP